METDELISAWKSFDPRLEAVTRSRAEAGEYDDAIFHAFKLVEALVQQRIKSSNFGIGLLNEAFDTVPQKIVIGDAANARSVKSLFEGALGFFRADRAHKEQPAVPCHSIEECVHFLQFADLLLRLLAKDRSLLPRVDQIQIVARHDSATAILHGVNMDKLDALKSQSRVFLLTAATAGEAEFEVPLNLDIPIFAYAGHELVYSGHLITPVPGQTPGNFYEVIDPHVPLFSDQEGKIPVVGFHGLLLRVSEEGKTYNRITPTQAIYERGQFVTHGPFHGPPGLGPTWCRIENGEAIPAWTGSLVTTPEVVGCRQIPTLGNLEALPNVIKLRPAESRPIYLRLLETDGPYRRHVPALGGEWNSKDESVAFASGRVVRGKAFGTTQLTIRSDSFRASVHISVENAVVGEKTVFFQGIRRIQQMRFDGNDNLYFCNQSDSVYRLSSAGHVTQVLKIPERFFAVSGIDCIELDGSGGLYVNNVSDATAFHFPMRDGSFLSGTPIGAGFELTKKSFARLASGEVFIACMGRRTGFLIRRANDGSEIAIPLDHQAWLLGAMPNGTLCVPDSSSCKIYLYDGNGGKVGEIEIPNKITISEILVVDSTTIYLTDFRLGNLVRLWKGSNDKWNSETTAAGLGNASGIARDSQGNLYVGDFGSDRIFKIYM